jgi:hypothetical protein
VCQTRAARVAWLGRGFLVSFRFRVLRGGSGVFWLGNAGDLIDGRLGAGEWTSFNAGVNHSGDTALKESPLTRCEFRS